MASYNDVLGVLRTYRNELEQRTQDEIASQFGNGTTSISAFAAREDTPAFATPLSNIHATGVGVRMKDRKMIKDDFTLKVYVFSKIDLKEKTPELTRRFNGIDVDVEALPVQLALLKRKAVQSPKSAATTIPQHRTKHRPIEGGISIAPINEPFAGTLGCFLQRITGGSKQIFALSNNHVMADVNRLPVGTSIVQPGPEVAQSAPEDVFAALSAFIPLQFPQTRLDPVINLFDAAIAIVSNETLIKKSAMFGISNYSPKVSVAVPGMRVIKSGRTTGVTTGIVSATRVNGVQVNYGSGNSPVIATFNDTITIVSDDPDKPFSLPGDSGSVILDQETGQPVALLFAGDGVTTTACDLGGVCKQFQAFPV